jgi:20S proteasome alpha/beta subunit
MTVIAYDGSLLVADGRATRGGSTLVSDNVKKLHQVTLPDLGKAVVGLVGALDVQGPFLMHLGEKGFTQPFDNFVGNDEDGPLAMRGLVLTVAKKQLFEISSDGGWFHTDTPTAIGSGCYIAQHLLCTGKDALTAVIETCKTEFSCGGTITKYDIGTKKFEYLTAR